MKQANYAGFGTRLLAAIVDGLILFFVNFLVSIPFGVSLNAGINGASTGNSGSGITFGLQIVISVLYYVVYQNKMRQTLGKKALGLRVVDANGATPGMGSLFLREIIGKWVSAIILLIGYFMVLWDPRKQALHDKIAGTFVVKV